MAKLITGQALPWVEDIANESTLKRVTTWMSDTVG